jgi:flagellar basal body-associated protein FliL
MKRKLSIIIILALFMLTACAYNASLVSTSYKALSISQTSYDTAMKMAADIDNRGLLKPDDKASILKLGSTYSTAHNAAVEALAKYSETKSSSDSELLEQQMTIASEALSSLLTIIKPYLED